MEEKNHLCTVCPDIESRKCCVNSLTKIFNGDTPIVSKLSCGDTDYITFLQDRIAAQQELIEKEQAMRLFNA